MKTTSKAAVLSNKPDNMTCYIAEKLFTGLFDVVHGQREGVPKKPDPSAALLLCEELGVTPAECLYVGDSGVRPLCYLKIRNHWYLSPGEDDEEEKTLKSPKRTAHSLFLSQATEF